MTTSGYARLFSAFTGHSRRHSRRFAAADTTHAYAASQEYHEPPSYWMTGTCSAH